MLITIKGTGFGTTPGTVTFLGADTDGNGNKEGDADDKIAASCAPQAWTDTEVTVAVPAGGVSGPLKLGKPPLARPTAPTTLSARPSPTSWSTPRRHGHLLPFAV